MSRRSTRIAAISAALLLVGALGVTPALAEEPDLTTKTLQAKGEVCTVIAQPTFAGQDIALTPEPTTQCFDSLGKALESVSGEPVTDPLVLAGDPAALQKYANAQAEKAGERAVAAPGPYLVMLGIAYKATNQGGTGKVLYGNGGGGCLPGQTYGFPKMADYLMNNNISSMASYARCWSTLYDLEQYQGTTTNCVPLCNTLGSMDNRTSSIVFRPNGTIA